MNDHAIFLFEEAEAAMNDGCPVTSNGLKRAGEEIERLQRNWDTALHESGAQDEEIERLQSRNELLGGELLNGVGISPLVVFIGLVFWGWVFGC